MRPLIKPDNYLYVAEFSDGTVKVGRTANVKRRLRDLRYVLQKASSDLVIERTWASGPTSYAGAWHAETALIAFCRANWPTAQGYEYFTAPFDSIAERAAAIFEAKHYGSPAVMYRKPRLVPRGEVTETPHGDGRINTSLAGELFGCSFKVWTLADPQAVAE